MKTTRRVCFIFLVFFTCFALFWAGCGTDDDLKIIIEDTTGGAGPTPPSPDTAGPPPTPDTAGPPPVPESGTNSGPGAPAVVDETAPPPSPPTGIAREMNMDVLEVVSLVTSSQEFEEDVILKALPSMMVGNRPQNALWGVRLMIRDTIIAEYVIDDNSRTIVMNETYFDRIRDVLEEHDETEFKKHLERFGSPELGYDDALKAAMASPLFLDLDTSREFWVSILFVRLEKKPTWNVSAGYKDSETFTHIIMDASGDIIAVKDSE